MSTSSFVVLMVVGFASFGLCVKMLNPEVVIPNGFVKLRSSGESVLYQMTLPASPTHQDYANAPYVADLRGSHYQIGYDYAALLHNETSYELFIFQQSLSLNESEQEQLNRFLDWMWKKFLSRHTPQEFLDELTGMHAYHIQHGSPDVYDTNIVAQRFQVVANLPADKPNVISMLENDLEVDWPAWLKDVVNFIIDRLEHKRCDAYGVWGSRTQNNLLFSSRNLDFASNTGINKYNLVTFISLNDTAYYPTGVPPGGKFVTLGFAFGIAALAGMNVKGMTVSEMNLDNSVVTFEGVPFPLRLRYILQRSTNLAEAMLLWNATNNTNSFNFLIGSATDATSTLGGALALETIRGYTAQFPANSSMERNAVYNCTADSNCKTWTNQTQGLVHIGHPLPEAVWRTNHGFDTVVLKTQEPLFTGTVYRYDLMYSLFEQLQQENTRIGDQEAVGIVATLGTKGGDDWTVCDPTQFKDGDNVMSIAYAPGPRPGSPEGYFFIAWESGGVHTNAPWRPAACSQYVRIDMSQFGTLPA